MVSQNRCIFPCRIWKIEDIHIAIPCPFFVGRVKRQRNPTHLLGYGFATLRERTSTQPTNQDFFRFGQGIDIAKTVPCLHGQLLWLTPRYAISKPYLFLHNS
ncbi:hypothetical protein [Anabaena sp. AL93]|jgi:hypothetical protein|uniref:hypothetical protein n=1 Tax=Anabaena sp. AL93 TaxID=1678133 RepID=UPI0025BECFDA|nr:hypothetical protein [Anabaena sp. AL93]